MNIHVQDTNEQAESFIYITILVLGRGLTGIFYIYRYKYVGILLNFEVCVLEW